MHLLIEYATSIEDSQNMQVNETETETVNENKNENENEMKLGTACNSSQIRKSDAYWKDL